jgi:hypothetical protein
MPELFDDLEAVPPRARRSSRRGGLIGVVLVLGSVLAFLAKEFWLDAAEAWGGAEQQRVIAETLDAADVTTRGHEAFEVEKIEYELGEALEGNVRLRLHLHLTCTGEPPATMPIVYVTLHNHQDSAVAEVKAVMRDPPQRGALAPLQTTRVDLTKTTLRQIRRVDVLVSP